MFGSYGIDQCLDLVEQALASGRGLPKPEGDDWLEGTGVALAMLDSGPPTEHRSGAEMRLLPDGTYHLAVGSTEMGNGSTTSHRQLAASVLDTRAGNIAIINGDTDQTPYDTGTFASTGTVVAGQAVEKTAAALRDVLIDFASRHFDCEPADCRLQDDAIICANRKIPLAELHAAGAKVGDRFVVRRKAYLSPRSVGFNVHGVRVAVHRVTGEIMILQSVHAADIGRLINPMQCRGQLDGAIAMGFGWALYEKMVYDENGAMVNPALRDYRIPAFADVPRSELYFADTYDKVGPLGAKAQGECAINPVAPGDRQRRRRRDRYPLYQPAAVARADLRPARVVTAAALTTFDPHQGRRLCLRYRNVWAGCQEGVPHATRGVNRKPSRRLRPGAGRAGGRSASRLYLRQGGLLQMPRHLRGEIAAAEGDAI